MARLFLREPAEAGRLAQRSVTVAREHGFSLYLTLGAIVQHCAPLQRGELEAGSVTMQEALAPIAPPVRGSFCRSFSRFLPRDYLQVGSIQDGLQVVTEALQLTETGLDIFWEAELYRLKGELTLAQSSVQSLGSRVQTNQKAKGKRQKPVLPAPVPQAQVSGVEGAKMTDPRPLIPDPQGEAEACFHKAIEIARTQGAKSLELRAVMSLSSAVAATRQATRSSTSCRRSTAGSRKGLIRKTCKQRRHCWQSSPEVRDRRGYCQVELRL